MIDFSGDSLFTVIMLFGIVQGLVLSAIVYFYPERDKNSNSLLSVFILSATVVLMAPLMTEVLGWGYVWIFHCVKFITISSLYLYIRSLSVHVGLRRTLKHFSFALLYLPVALHFVWYVEQRYDVSQGMPAIKDGYNTAIAIGNLAYVVFYTVLYFKAYRDHKRSAETNFSSISKLGLTWIKQLLFGFLTIIVISYALFAYALASDVASGTACLINMAAISAYLYFVTVRGKISPEVYKLRALLLEVNAGSGQSQELKSEKKEAAQSADESHHLNAIAGKIEKLMREDALYRNENLTIKDLAEAVGEQPYLVSQAINKVLGMNFFELVNTHRVEHAKRILSRESELNYSLVGIGFESGFNSKTTFNTAFKKITGQTPSQFRKSFFPEGSEVRT